MSEAVLFSRADRVGVITLNRPEARNAVNADVARGLEAAVDQVKDDPELWVGVLSANTEGQVRPRATRRSNTTAHPVNARDNPSEPRYGFPTSAVVASSRSIQSGCV